MSEKPNTAARITLAFAGIPTESEALEGLVRLAAALNADLEGIFVEDVNLLRLARLPVARGYSYLGQPLTFEVQDVARRLHQQAAAVRNELMRLAERAGARWHFTTDQGSLAVQAQRRAAESTAVAIGFSQRRQALFATTRSQRARSLNPNAIAIVYLGTPASKRALDLGVRLASALDRPVTLLIPSQVETPQLPRGCVARHLTATQMSAADIVTMIRREQPILAVMEANETTVTPGAIEQFTDGLPCPTILVR